MKKLIKKIMLVLTVVLCMSAFTACDDIEVIYIEPYEQLNFYCDLSDSGLSSGDKSDLIDWLTDTFRDLGWKINEQVKEPAFGAYKDEVRLLTADIDGYEDLDYGFFFYHYDFEFENPMYYEGGINSSVSYIRSNYPIFDGAKIVFFYGTDRAMGSGADRKFTQDGLYFHAFETTIEEALNGAPTVKFRKYWVNYDGWTLLALVIGAAFITTVLLLDRKKRKNKAAALESATANVVQGDAISQDEEIKH